MATQMKNSISLLKEYHDRMKKNDAVHDPTYIITTVGSQLFSCRCTYRDFTTEATGPSKSCARSSAATQMLKKLNHPVRAALSTAPVIRKNVEPPQLPSTPTRVLIHQNSTTVLLAKEFLKNYNNAENANRFVQHSPTSEDLETCFFDINYGLKSPNAPKSKTLCSRLDKEMHPITCFEQVMNELKFKFCVDSIDVHPTLEGKAFVVLLRIDFCCMVVGGLGNSLPEAIEKACKNGLDTLRLYMN